MKSDDNTRVASTFNLNSGVKECETDLGDSKLLTKLAAGDMAAIESQYHVNCLSVLYYIHVDFTEAKESKSNNTDVHGIVFAELVSYINECRGDEVKPIFEMSELKELCTKMLNNLV